MVVSWTNFACISLCRPATKILNLESKRIVYDITLVSDRVVYDIIIQGGGVVDMYIPEDKETDEKGFVFP